MTALTRDEKAAVTLEVDPRSVRAAREHVESALAEAGLEEFLDVALLAVSEVVTNAIVHTGSEVELRVLTGDRSVRVEVEDRGMQVPTRRAYSDSSGTGRGMGLVEDTVRRWGIVELADGKVVWFELGHPEDHGPDPRSVPHEQVDQDLVLVRLRGVPLLMHVAWQEHASALLREHLLHVLEHDPHAMSSHAQASEAMSLLHAQVPVPELGADPEVLMAAATEPHVTADLVVLELPSSAIDHFVVLEQLLSSALAKARAGELLSPPTQPEIVEMRQWLCAEIARQAAGDPTAIPYVARTDVRATVADRATLRETFADLTMTGDAIVATDEAGVVVAVSASALALLGYASADDLLGRRVIAVIPPRFHQAHIAGTTLHATNGRDVLLGVPVSVPMVRADGSEVAVELTVRAEQDPRGQRVFVGCFTAA